MDIGLLGYLDRLCFKSKSLLVHWSPSASSPHWQSVVLPLKFPLRNRNGLQLASSCFRSQIYMLHNRNTCHQCLFGGANHQKLLLSLLAKFTQFNRKPPQVYYQTFMLKSPSTQLFKYPKYHFWPPFAPQCVERLRDRHSSFRTISDSSKDVITSSLLLRLGLGKIRVFPRSCIIRIIRIIQV